MLKIEHLSKKLGNHPVLQDLDMVVEDGSILGLVGVNGAGKSTLLRLIAGVYKADAGSITLDGADTYQDAEVRGRIAFVSDELYYPIGSTVASLKQFYQTMYSFDQTAYEKHLKMFELDEGGSISNFSKGMKRRVSLLFALSIQPRLILLDEAYDGLEPLVRLKFRNALTDMLEDTHTSVIISSHNLKELEDVCDSFGILEGGRIVSYGDLLQSRENINKYQVAFRQEKVRADFSHLDLLHYEKEGQVYKLVIRGDEQAVQQQLQQMDPILLNILPVNFEELFIYELESRGEGNEQ